MEATFQLKESAREYTAKLSLIAGAADPATRMVPVTAQVDATEHQYRLRPGAFVSVNVPVGTAREGIVVPSLAVQPTEKGNVVYVVDDKHIAHAKVVQLGMHTAEGGIELTRGVAAGEQIVVRGLDPLTDGAPVKVASTMTLEQASAPPPDAGVPGATEPQTPPVTPAGAAKDSGKKTAP
jgi:multidrug efflux system membrane fusion protein